MIQNIKFRKKGLILGISFKIIRPMIVSPFHKLSKIAEKRLTFTLLISVVILIVVMRHFDGPLKNSVSTFGIVSFELAMQLTRSQAILDSWDVAAKTSAGISLGIDFLFLLVYSSFISLLIHQVNERLWQHTKVQLIGFVMIYGVFLAALFDVIENIALIQLLLGDFEQYWSSMAYYFAFLKFGLLTLGIAYILVSTIILIIKRERIRFI